MEQKQLDEIDESYFGEEFIDEAPFEEVKIEEAKPKKKTTKKKASKTAAASKKKKSSKKKEKIDTGEKNNELEEEIQKEMEKITMEKDEPVVEEEIKVEVLQNEPEKKEEVKKEEPVESKPVDPWKDEEKTESVKPSKPVDPWKEEEEAGNGIFGEISTWKAVTGIMLILLLFSIFTQGFQFSEEGITGASVGEGISLTEAEGKVLDFVNEYLLQPPFTAELINSEDTGALYKMTLNVMDQEVDSYVTKDGELFFPQGLSMDPEELGLEEMTEEEISELDIDEELEKLEEMDGEIEEEIVEDKPVTSSMKKINLDAQKWLFTPDLIEVQEGDFIKLTINPKGLDFTFAIPELDIEEEVEGPTEIVFDVDDLHGSFEFKCSSCEDWRGMTGTLIVE